MPAFRPSPTSFGSAGNTWPSTRRRSFPACRRKDLGVVSSAVYRYVENRDELLTLLLIDAYNQLGDDVDAAVNAEAEDDFAAQFTALANAVRTWAIREPASYSLLFGSPVPGYQAPGERTTVLVRGSSFASSVSSMPPTGLARSTTRRVPPS